MLDDLEDRLIDRALDDGLPLKEITATLRQVRKREPRDPIIGDRKRKSEHQPIGLQVKPYAPSDNPEALPADLVSTDPWSFLRRIFRPDERIGITFPDPETGEKSHNANFTLNQIDADPKMQGWFEDKFLDPSGTFFTINPLDHETSTRKDTDVVDFRYLLVEIDGTEGRPDLWPTEKQVQFANLKESGLPFAALYDSGGKSIHGLVKVDASDAREFEQRATWVYQYLAELGIDDHNKNEARLSRLPGCKRGEGFQTLLTWDVGAKSFGEWITGADFDDGLPDDTDLCEFLEADIVEPKHLLQNFLRVGQVGIISGAAKTNKSWTMMELALAVSQGKGRFLKWQALQGKVYYVDTELESFDFQRRMKSIAKQIGAKVDPGEFRKLLIRGVEATLDALVPALIRRLKGKGYELICIDAIYSVLGAREENANEDIAQIGGLLFRLARETGAAVLFSHHFSKGNQGKKRGIEKASGAGAWGRFPDVSLSIDRPNSKSNLYNIEPTFRSFAPVDEFVAERVNGIWSIRDGMAPVKSDSGKNVITEILDVLVNECGGEATPGEWAKACEETLKISRSGFDKRKVKAENEKLVRTLGMSRKTVCKLAEGVRRTDSDEYVKGADIKITSKAWDQSKASAPRTPEQIAALRKEHGIENTEKAEFINLPGLN
jgi:RecA-family ATPase